MIRREVNERPAMARGSSDGAGDAAGVPARWLGLTARAAPDGCWAVRFGLVGCCDAHRHPPWTA